MRPVSTDKQKICYTALKEYLEGLPDFGGSSPRILLRPDIQTISGVEEGFYGFIGVNEYRKAITFHQSQYGADVGDTTTGAATRELRVHPEKMRGIIEIGGASMQVVTPDRRAMGSSSLVTFSSLFPKLFSQSYLNFGLEQVKKWNDPQNACSCEQAPCDASSSCTKFFERE
ncbi:unnamed protein product, partial [Amoebophrya sp. A25]|eukprot:GSA25T00005205001.1